MVEDIRQVTLPPPYDRSLTAPPPPSLSLQFRLCPASKPLTESCFAAMPLKFAEPAHTLKYKDHDLKINATLVPDSVTGTGDWLMNPIPSYASDNVGCDVDCTSTDPAFGGGRSSTCTKDKHCHWSCPGCGAPTYAADTACPAKCAESYPQYFPSGKAYVGADKGLFPDPHGLSKAYHSFAVEDELVVPADIPAGNYVLGWRWDCEQVSDSPSYGTDGLDACNL